MVLLGAGGVSAHAVLLRVTPSGSQTLQQAPAEVQLLFSEPIDPVFSAARVYDSVGSEVDNGDSHIDPNNDQVLIVTLPPGLPNGVYMVSWRNLSSIDVHPDEGQYRLYVGVPVASGAVDVQSSVITATPETTIGRWWFYLAASLFGGVLATWKFVFGGLLVDARAELRPIVRRRAYRLIVAGGIFLIVGTVFTAVAQAAAAANVPFFDAIGKPLSDPLLRGRFATIGGRAWASKSPASA